MLGADYDWKAPWAPKKNSPKELNQEFRNENRAVKVQADSKKVTWNSSGLGEGPALHSEPGIPPS